MAGFVPMKTERSWVPFGRPIPLPVPDPEPELVLTPPPVAPDPLAGERQRLERVDQDRAQEHKRRLAELDQAIAAAKAEELRFATLCGQMDTLRTKLLAELRSAAGELVVSTAARIAGSTTSSPLSPISRRRRAARSAASTVRMGVGSGMSGAISSTMAP